jgi:hypothetical protein
MTLPLALRGLVVLLLLLAMARGDGGGSADPGPLVLHPWDSGPGGGRQMTTAAAPVLAGAARPSVVVRPSTSTPTGAELELLAALAARAPLLVALPGDVPALWVEPPGHARTERAAAVAFGVTARPGGDTVRVRLYDGAGPVDSLAVVVPASGRVEGAFRVRPTRAGWQDWRIEAVGATRRAGAWVHEALPPHVLLLAGPPTWESRFVLRALDEAGARTAAVIPLGRGLHAGDAGPSMPADSASMARYDAVLLLPGAVLDAGALRTLERYVAGGGGLLAVGHNDAWRAFGLSDSAGAEGEVAGAAVRWQLPAELAPLPAAELRVPVLPLGAAGPGAFVAAMADDGAPLLAVRQSGMGRVAALGVLETWRWRMEAGRVDEHREFWRSLADWLAGQGSAPLRVHLPATEGPTGAAVHVELYGHASAPGGAVTHGGAPPVLRLERPDGTSELLVAGRPASAQAGAGAEGHTPVWRAAFLPVTEGVYRIGLAGGEAAAIHAAAADAAEDVPGQPAAGGTAHVAAAFHATAAGAAAGAADGFAIDGAARLALLAWASGGSAVPADSVLPWLAARQAEFGAVRGGEALRWLLLAALLAAAAAEWTVRRLSGRR